MRFLFLKVKTSKYKNSLNYGTFSFKKGMTNSEIIKIIGENAYVESTVKVTFPEGSSVEQMAQIVKSASLVSETDFLNALNESYDYEFLKYIPTANYKYKLQGCLFPSTYEFFKSASAHEIVDKMLAEQQTQLKKLNVKNENVFDTLIKASIIEKEAKLDSERATVAGVIEDRLAVGMPLQIDACVVYAVTDGLYNIPALYENQLKTNSPCRRLIRIRSLSSRPHMLSRGKFNKGGAKPRKAQLLLLPHRRKEEGRKSYFYGNI